MAIHWSGLFWGLSFIFALSSCGNLNPFDNHVQETFPDTIVSISPDEETICKTLIRYSDSFEIRTHYRTNPLTGRILYKMYEAPYRNNRLHGKKYKFNAGGDTIYSCDFFDGVKSNIETYSYPNGQLKQKYYYANNRSGHKVYELNFHPNGLAKTDTIQYYEGMLNGAIDYYDSTAANKLSERYYYVDDKLISVKIFNEKYVKLQRQTELMRAQAKKDSMELAQNGKDSTLQRDKAIILQSAQRSGTKALDVDEWSMLREDPNFILFEKK